VVANAATALHVMQVRDNPTRALVAEAVAEGRLNVLLDANPALVSLGAMLLQGEPGDLRLRFEVKQSCTQGNGVVSGGTLASMLDIAMAMAVLSVLPLGRTCATTSLSVNMIASAQAGAFLARATVDRSGRSVAFARADLYHPDGQRLLATASSTLALFDERPA
jgi:uncharacterized protein (TIGR00369 family)